MQGMEATEVKASLPSYRYGLKGKVHAAGFRTMREFAEVTKIDEALLSRIVTGWLYPSPKQQVSISRALRIAMGELRELLQ